MSIMELKEIKEAILKLRDKHSIIEIKSLCNDLTNILNNFEDISNEFDMVFVYKPKPLPEQNPEQNPDPDPEVLKYGLYFMGFTDGKKIPVIKALREITGLGLVEAKEIVETNPGQAFKTYTNQSVMYTDMDKLVRAGAIINWDPFKV